MLEAQRLIERAAGSDDNMATARQGVEGMLAEFYRGVGWQVTVQWKSVARGNNETRHAAISLYEECFHRLDSTIDYKGEGTLITTVVRFHLEG